MAGVAKLKQNLETISDHVKILALEAFYARMTERPLPIPMREKADSPIPAVLSIMPDVFTQKKELSLLEVVERHLVTSSEMQAARTAVHCGFIAQIG